MADYFRLLPAGEQFLDDDGVVLSGGKLHTYEAGTTTDKATYQGDTSGDSAHANPIVLGSDGRLQSGDGVFGATGAFKLVLKDSGDNTLWTRDDVVGVGDDSNVASEWVTSGLTPTFVDASNFSVVGDQTSTLHVGRRVQVVETAGTVYGTITATSYADPNTTLTVLVDGGGSIDSGISSFKYALTSNVNSSAPNRVVVTRYDVGDSPATWTKTAGLKYARVCVQAGGGAGGGVGATTTGSTTSAGGGGGAGGYSEKTFLASELGGTETATIGAGGGGVNNSDGDPGGTSSFTTNATTLQATGGSGGAAGTASAQTNQSAVAGGTGGLGSGGDMNARGGPGGPSLYGDGTKAMSGIGGSSMFGGSVSASLNTSQVDGNDASGSGGGGSGARNGDDGTNGIAQMGGDGSDGFILVYEYF